ncbi:MAG: hypothetical protein HGB31_07750 [Erysipelotrichaceae bacterium]|jgi:hypothetical protein|nr:hypothetical protein [Erysipelotrichaceae bacterium]
MLIKSIKHDLLSTYRDFLSVYSALLVIALIGPFIVNSGVEWMIAILFLGIFGFSVATFVITFLTIIRLYNRRLFSAEGYLTLTLPVKTSTTIIAKVVTGFIWSTLTVIVFGISMLIFGLIYYWTNGAFKSVDYLALMDIIEMITDTGAVWTVIQSVFVGLPLTILDSIYSLVLLVFVMTLINTSLIKKYRVPVGIAIYMVISGLLSSILAIFHGAAIVFSTGDPMFITGPFDYLTNFGYSINWVSYMIQFIGMVVYIAGLGYGSWWLLEHKLEIE